MTLVFAAMVGLMMCLGCSQSHVPNALDSAHAPEGPGWEPLITCPELSNWTKRPNHNRPMSWKVVDGVLVNDIQPGQHGVDILTKEKFDDFEIYYEYVIPEGSNSGVFLRGRYEVQILDDYGQEPAKHCNGGLYSVVAPAENVSRKPGQWQSVYAKIEGRTISVILNGVKVVDSFEVTRPTGGELDRDEDQPGPIMIQGDHGAIKVRNMWIREL
jgi:hypothetical protein